MTDIPESRLNKLLALQLGVSRRESDEMIEAGRVMIDNKIAPLGARVIGDAVVTVDGKRITATPAFVYIALNKPVGYVCSRKAQGENPTIYELLPTDMHTLKPVGRLDKHSSGLILLTNDGDFAHQMTHPKFSKVKVYRVLLNKPLEPLHQQMISDYGIEIGDGTSKLGLERMNDERTKWTITMSEGRNRQIRRTFAALGYETESLHRISFGKFSDAGITRGRYRTVSL